MIRITIGESFLQDEIKLQKRLYKECLAMDENDAAIGWRGSYEALQWVIAASASFQEIVMPLIMEAYDAGVAEGKCYGGYDEKMARLRELYRKTTIEQLNDNSIK